MSKQERTYIMVKPDGVQRGLIGEIIHRFERKGFKLVAMKFMQPTKELLEQHYADLKSKPFFPGLVSFMATSPVCCMVSVCVLRQFCYLGPLLGMGRARLCGHRQTDAGGD